MPSVARKLTESSPHYPADFDHEETVAIIDAGMGSNAAGTFRTNAQECRGEIQPSSSVAEQLSLMTDSLGKLLVAVDALVDRVDVLQVDALGGTGAVGVRECLGSGAYPEIVDGHQTLSLVISLGARVRYQLRSTLACAFARVLGSHAWQHNGSDSRSARGLGWTPSRILTDARVDRRYRILDDQRFGILTPTRPRV